MYKSNVQCWTRTLKGCSDFGTIPSLDQLAFCVCLLFGGEACLSIWWVRAFSADLYFLNSTHGKSLKIHFAVHASSSGLCGQELSV